MKMRAFFLCLLLFPSLLAAAEKPNIVIVFTDDQGYADLGCYGAEGFKTPNIDRLATEGRRFTNFYAGATICSPSRASILTGCYPDRVGIVNFVFFPTRGNEKGVKPGPGPNGLHPNEITIAEMLKEQGYTTACVGKWHLGDAKPFLPTRQGFDEYFGLPYSNDMRNGPMPPKSVNKTGFPPLPLYHGEEIIETDPDQRFLTRRYTERAVDFIRRNREKPFFLYLPHSMPHVPLYVHPDFEGKSEQGLYGDVIQEIDWSVGRILETLKDCGIDEKTWVIFSTDNGPWLTMGTHGGKATPLRDGKQTKYDGGHRVPCVMRYPGKIKPGTVGNEIISSIDLLPTIARVCGGKVPDDLHTVSGPEKIDGLTALSGTITPNKKIVLKVGEKIVSEKQVDGFITDMPVETLIVGADLAGTVCETRLPNFKGTLKRVAVYRGVPASRAVLMTGMHPGHCVIRDNREVRPEGQEPLPKNTVTLVGELKKRGYVAGAFGKWGLGAPDSVASPLRVGFDRFYGYNCQREAHSY